LNLFPHFTYYLYFIIRLTNPQVHDFYLLQILDSIEPISHGFHVSQTLHLDFMFHKFKLL